MAFGKIPRLIFNKIMSMAYFAQGDMEKSIWSQRRPADCSQEAAHRSFICVSPQSTTPASATSNSWLRRNYCAEQPMSKEVIDKNMMPNYPCDREQELWGKHSPYEQMLS